MNTAAINGLVLSGGNSKRMGKDKGELYYHNKSQRRHLYELLLPYCKEVFISCNAEQSKHINDMPVIKDAFLNIGPLGGILSAFKTYSNSAWLAVACDLPFLNNETINYLIKHRNPNKIATAFWNKENKSPEPLIVIWESGAYPILLQFLSKGNSSPRNALINSDIEILNAPDILILKNVNTKEEYIKAKSLIDKNVKS